MNTETLIVNEAWVKFGVFIGLLLVLFTAEYFFRRRRPESLMKRWTSNFGLIASATLLSRLIFPFAGVGTALWAEANHVGMFHFLPWPQTLEIFLALVMLDLAIYWQHRLFHIFPFLWRMHRAHHSDLGYDTSLGIRFHPFEIALSQAYKLGWVLLLGVAPIAILIYESLLMGFSLFTHADIRIPLKLDAVLRKLIVTPDFHRVHHSVHRMETDSNYGNILSLWDRLFSSYCSQPRDGHETMQIGLHEFRTAPEQKLGALLIQPFRNVKTLPDDQHA